MNCAWAKREGRTAVVVLEAHAAVAREIGIPVGDWFEVLVEGAAGAHLGREREAESAEHGEEDDRKLKSAVRDVPSASVTSLPIRKAC